jgi:hypothetical protein
MKLTRKNFIGPLCAMLGIIGFVFIAGLSAHSAYAQNTDYHALQPLPYATDNGGVTNLTKYIAGMFQLVIALTTFISVIAIIIGGFQYITADTIGGKSGGRERIVNALTGLILAIASYLILYTINPNLTQFNFNLSFQRAPTGAVNNAPGTGGGAGSTGTTPIGSAIDPVAAEASLEASGITLSSTGNCTAQIAGCTSLIGIQATTITGIEALKASCTGCNNLVITGGTEPGHTDGDLSHANGYKVDISDHSADGAALTAYLNNQVTAQTGEAPVPNVPSTIVQNGYTYTVMHETNPSHWDIKVIKN